MRTRSQSAVQRAIARADLVLPGRPTAIGRPDPRWQAIIGVAAHIESHPEQVWEFASRWGKHPQADLRTAIATCLLEHLLEHHFELLFARVRQAALGSVRFAGVVNQCWAFGRAELPDNAARLERLRREMRRCHRRSRARPKR